MGRELRLDRREPARLRHRREDPERVRATPEEQRQEDGDRLEIRRGRRPSVEPHVAAGLPHPPSAPSAITASGGAGNGRTRTLRSGDERSLRAAIEADLPSPVGEPASPVIPELPPEQPDPAGGSGQPDPDDEPVSPERRAQIEGWTEELIDEEYVEYGRSHDEAERVAEALRGDSDLGALTRAEQQLLLDQQLERWTHEDDRTGQAHNYNALRFLAEDLAGDPTASAVVADTYAQRAAALLQDPNAHPSDRAEAASFATDAITAAGSPEGRRELIERLGPEGATDLVRALALDPEHLLDGGSFAYGSVANEELRIVAATDLLDALGGGEPTAASAAAVDAAFATTGSHAYHGDWPGDLSGSMGRAMAHHWYPDDPGRAQAEGQRLGEVLETRQGRNFLGNLDLPLETRLQQLDLVRQHPEWDRDFFRQEDTAFDNPAIAFALASPTAVQYQDLRGDTPQALRGTDLENTIGFAIGFPPQGIPENETPAARDARERAVAEGRHSLFQGEPAEEIVGDIADSIREVGGDEAQVTVLPIQYGSEGSGAVQLPLFRVQDRETGEDRFVDNTGRIYDNFDDWRHNNVLPPGNMVFPTDGHLSDDVHLTSANTPQTVDSTSERLTQFLDRATLVGGTIAGGAIILGSGGTLAPVVLGGAAAWQTYRSVDALNDRYQHGQSINPFTDAGARTDWLNAGAGAFSLASLGATGIAGRLASSGSRLAFGGATAASVLRIGAGVLDAGAAGNAGHQLFSRWDELSGSERASLALSAGFWGVGTAAAGPRGARNVFDLPAIRDDILYGHLDPSVRSALDTYAPTRGGSDTAGAQIASSESFRAMTAAQQRQFLVRYGALPESARASFDASFATSITRPEVQAALFDVVGSSRLTQLPEAARTRVVQNIAGLDDATAAALRADWASHPTARTTLLELTGTRAFGGLDPAAQRGVIESLDTLPSATRRVFAEQLDGLGYRPSDAQVLADLVQTQGFRNLSPTEAQTLLHYTGGTNAQISGPARAALATELQSSAFQGLTAAQQAAALRRFMTDQPGLPPYVVDGSFPGQTPSTLRPPVFEPNVPFASGTRGANRYDLEIDGRVIPIYAAPGSPGSGLHTHSVQEIQAAIARMPPEARARINQVHLDPRRSVDDAHWAQEFGDPDFRSYMTADAQSGVLTIHPTEHPQSATTLTGSLVHEAGHFDSLNRWGDRPDTDAGWADWRAAVASDGLSASQYARNNYAEDFAETYRLYQQVRGTPAEVELRAIMPERFAILDSIYGSVP